MLTKSISQEKTLIEIIKISKDLITGFRIRFSWFDFTCGEEYHNTKIPYVLSQLERIVLASGMLLRDINRSILHDITLDYHSKHWLSGKEPKACLETLQQMEDLAKDDVSALSAGTCTENMISLFEERQSCFRFLLETDIR